MSAGPGGRRRDRGTLRDWGFRSDPFPGSRFHPAPLRECSGFTGFAAVVSRRKRESECTADVRWGKPAACRNPAENSFVVANNDHLILVSWAVQTLLSHPL